MGYARVNDIIQRTVDELVEAGASREEMERLMNPVELVAIQNIADSQKNQLLLNFDYKTADLAKRFGVCERTVRYWRNAAIERRAIAATVAA